MGSLFDFYDWFVNVFVVIFIGFLEMNLIDGGLMCDGGVFVMCFGGLSVNLFV